MNLKNIPSDLTLTRNNELKLNARLQILCRFAFQIEMLEVKLKQDLKALEEGRLEIQTRPVIREEIPS